MGLSKLVTSMVAKPDIKSGFETDSNQDLTKIMIRFKIQISDSNPVFI
jgi:hypothetical protein